jgi:DhnA family fructose-bisphosphate aldolase class Ia
LTSTGKALRLKRIFQDDGKSLIVAYDHCPFMGPAPGLAKPEETISKIVEGGADAIMTMLGVIKQYSNVLSGKMGLIWSIPPVPDYIQDAAKMSVDAVKLTYFASLDYRQIVSIMPVATECEKWGIPLLVEFVPMADGKQLTDAKSVKFASRLAQEYGADLVKTMYTGSAETFKEVTEVLNIPVVILGGERMENDRQVLETVKGCLDGGGAGIAMGRNIWQHKDPIKMTRAISKILHENFTVDEALKEIS